MDFINKKRNGNKLQRFFLTFPKCNAIDSEQFASILPPYNYLIRCDELHQDGTPHIHISCHLTDKISKPQLLKIYKENYPGSWKRIHIYPTRNFSASIEYCKKDKNYVEEGIPDLGSSAPTRKRKPKRTDDWMFEQLKDFNWNPEKILKM